MKGGQERGWQSITRILEGEGGPGAGKENIMHLIW